MRKPAFYAVLYVVGAALISIFGVAKDEVKQLTCREGVVGECAVVCELVEEAVGVRHSRRRAAHEANSFGELITGVRHPQKHFISLSGLQCAWVTGEPAPPVRRDQAAPSLFSRLRILFTQDPAEGLRPGGALGGCAVADELGDQ